jgi:phage anti-repressor protein
MKNFLPLLLFPLISFCQEKPKVKSFEIYTNKELTLIAKYDSTGNCIFMKNIGMNGPITMLFIDDHDEQGRKTKSYWAHSNLGYMLSENVYADDRIYSYSYTGDSTTNEGVERSKLNSIDDREEFFALPEIKTLGATKKYLQSIDFTDSLNRTESSYSISEEGDTTTITTMFFDKNWEEVRFRYESQDDSSWVWDIYYDYDDKGRKIRSYRVEMEAGVTDTSEVYNYTYDEFGRMIEDNYYYRGEFKNKTVYQYDKKDQLIEELFFEQENEWDVVTDYKYDKKTGWIKKKVVMDLRLSAKKRKKVLIYKYHQF